jgi:diguanylate cyclase (GGDEF)-like protein
MRVGALRLVRVGLEPVDFVGARGETREPPETLSAAERRWWPLTDLPVLIGAVLAVLVLPAGRPFDVAAAVALVALFVVAYQVKVPLGAGWASGVQPVFVAMLVLQPARVVPLLVVAGSLIGAVADVIVNKEPRARLPRVIGNQWFALPPAVIVALAPQPVPWQWWVAAILAGFAADGVMAHVRDIAAGTGSAPWRVHLTPALFDAIVTLPVLFTCLQAPGTAAAWVVPVSLVAMSAVVARERGSRVRNEQLARHDPLTDLPNRRLFEQLLAGAGARAARSGHDGAVMIVDLDGFKAVNDTHGHPAGDEVLREVAARLREIVRAGDEVARVGGDEFALLLADAEGASHVSEALDAAFAAPIVAAFETCAIGVSTGWATFGAHRLPEDAVEQADRRMYAHKRSKGARE